MSEVRLGIIGAGNIARKHIEVIRNIQWITVAGITSRTRSKAEEIAREFDISECCDDSQELVNKCRPDALIVLVSADQIFSLTKEVIPHKIPFFMEKPPSLVPKETNTLAELACEHSVSNMVGYNRRYYTIFKKGIEIIRKYGKLLGVAVEGHERFWRIAGKLNDTVRPNWIYANSTHTIDLLRFFGGEPSNVQSLSKSYIEKNGDQFAAILEFKTGAIGHYSSHWYSPGGWCVKLYGEGVTVVFKPLEKGVWIDTDFVEHEITPDDVDIKYKPGFYRQMEAFRKMVQTGTLAWPGQGLEDALKTMELAQQISNG